MCTRVIHLGTTRTDSYLALDDREYLGTLWITVPDKGIPKLRLLRGGGLGPSDCESYLNVLRGDDLQVVGAILCKLETLACSVLGDHSEGILVDCYSEQV